MAIGNEVWLGAVVLVMLGRVVDVNEFMRQTELRRDMGSHRRRTVALGCMVATCQVGHATFTRQVCLRLGEFTGDEGIGSGGNGSFKIALRSTAAPCYFFNSSLLIRNKGYRSI